MQVLFVTDYTDDQITFCGTGDRCLAAVLILSWAGLVLLRRLIILIASLLSVGYVMFFSCTVVSTWTTSSSANSPCKPTLIRKIRSTPAHLCAYENAPVPCYGKAASVGILSYHKKPGNKDCASAVILPIRHSNSLTASVSITQPSAGSAYSAHLSLRCNGWKVIPQILPGYRWCKLQQWIIGIKLHQQICFKQIRSMNRTATS